MSGLCQNRSIPFLSNLLLSTFHVCVVGSIPNVFTELTRSWHCHLSTILLISLLDPNSNSNMYLPLRSFNLMVFRSLTEPSSQNTGTSNSAGIYAFIYLIRSSAQSVSISFIDSTNAFNESVSPSYLKFESVAVLATHCSWLYDAGDIVKCAISKISVIAFMTDGSIDGISSVSILPGHLICLKVNGS